MNKRLTKIAAYLGSKGLHEEAAELKALAMVGEMGGDEENLLSFLYQIKNGKAPAATVAKQFLDKAIDRKIIYPDVDDLIDLAAGGDEGKISDIFSLRGSPMQELKNGLEDIQSALSDAMNEISALQQDLEYKAERMKD